jgi:gluconokinase
MPDASPHATKTTKTTSPPHALQVVVMGVAGCGKSTVGQLLARELSLPMIEGDEFHPPGNIQKMQQGIALTDEDRAEWLHLLGAQLASRPDGVVLTCSALKTAYRDSLRRASARVGRPLYFVYLAISPDESLRRVASRKGHYYPPSLVASQFEALQDPSAEPGVLSLPGDQPVEQLAQQAVTWLFEQK